ncbi:MAG TPA: efflux RND transporter periplasmic adaptor subunit [Candidatus Methylomirabilis sp.]|nr:efflux RND transporter periplasmic adaptor subunit [Candidatus Methylomirabilis sp.]
MGSKRIMLLAVGVALAGWMLPISRARSVELDGLIEPYRIVNVASPLDGVLEQVAVERGDVVKKGQVVAVLESSVQRAALAVAKARAEVDTSIESGQVRLDYSVRRVASNEDLLAKKGISEREVDDSRAQRDLSRIALEDAKDNLRVSELQERQAEAELAVRIIRSPIDGVVMDRLLSPMEQTKQTPIVKLAQLDPLRVEVIAPVALLGKVTVGMAGDVIPEAPVGGVYPAQVTVVDRVVDAASGTFGVRLELRNPGYRLPAGLKCKVHLAR